MRKPALLFLALGLLVLLAGGAIVLSKPRRKAVAELSAQRAIVDKLTDNARVRRDDARSLKTDSEASLKAGDYASAMEERLKMLNFDKPKISNLGAMSFYATQSLALDDIGRIASRLDAPAARRYADELEKRDAKLFDYSQVLTDQKAGELKQLDDLAKDPGDLSKVAQELGFTAPEKAALQSLTFPEIRGNIAAFYDRAIADAKLPYSPARARPTGALDPYTKNYATAYAADRFAWARAKTQRALTVAALRARADRLENKAATAPLPLDPFGTGPLQSKGNVVYSVGPDALDDGGRLMPTSYRAGAKGDVGAPTF